MSNLIINFFKEPPLKEEIKDNSVVDKMFKYWSFRIFYTTYIAYILVHLCRKNIAVALPFMGSELHLTNTQLGILGSTLYITYGVGKFFNGILADKTNIRAFLPTAFILTGIANLCFLYSTIYITPDRITFFGLPSCTVLLWVLAFFWGANGWFQSMVFPPISKALSYWIAKSERATKWSIWTTSHKCGVFVSVLFSGFLVQHFGWRSVFYVPAIISIIFSLWLFERLRDKPQTMGLPDIDKYKNEKVDIESDEDNLNNMSYLAIFKKYVLCNKIIWLIALSFSFVYLVRFSVEDWFIKYLVEYKNNTIELATSKLSLFAVFGSIGAIASGFMSDKLFNQDRIKINIIFFIGLILSLIFFHVNKINTLDYFYVALIGFFEAGPQFLLGGVCALEASTKKVASAALGFCGMFGYLGAILSSTGTGVMVDNFGWKGAVIFWALSAIIGLFTCALIILYKRKEKLTNKG
ncbi:MFS transporter [bacterium]|nr:MFS transporter [bacterium]